MASRTKTIKVSEDEYNMLINARRELERQGYGRLEDDLEEVNVGELLAGLALGAIAAIGTVALIKMLSDE